jgi:thiamine biosynthesis lipoprotein
MRSRTWFLLLFGAGAILVLVFVTRSPLQTPRPWSRSERSSPGRFLVHTAPIMSTEIQVVLPDSGDATGAAEAVFSLFRELEETMSEWKESSPLASVNREAGGAPVEVPAELFGVLSRGKEIGAMTGGAFDITWAALWGLWDFKAENPVVPDPQEIRRRTALVDYRRLELDPEARTARLARPGMLVGLGGIVKGYALDRGASLLLKRGYRDFMIVAGGQVWVQGERDGRPWRVGIRDPRGVPEDYFALLEVSDTSVSTSGDYESYFILDGVLYHHILDPRTGRPARGLRSATVVAPEGILADALSTAFMVLGRDRSLALADSLPGVEAVLVDSTGGVWTTPGLGDRIEPRHDPAP